MSAIHDGVKTFQNDVYPAMQARFEELAGGQAPPTLFITCSDSRVDPSLITQQGPGELFVSRNAGNLIPVHGEDEGTASAVEYAVAALGVELIVVCGHSGCGAMGGLLNPGSLESLPRVAAWVAHAESTAEAVADTAADERLGAAISHNAAQQLENLKTHPTVQAALEAGSLKMQAWVYDIGSGAVSVVAEV